MLLGELFPVIFLGYPVPTSAGGDQATGHAETGYLRMSIQLTLALEET